MKIEENKSLKELTTFKIGGSARYFCEPKNIPELKEAVLFARDKKLNIFILGGGSNLVVSDNGWDGLVIKPNFFGIKEEYINDSAVKIISGASVVWDDLVEFSVSKNLFGLENLSGIPGRVGASPVQNIGAYGVEAKDVISQVTAFNMSTFSVEEFLNKDCQFAYRDSFFKSKKGKSYIITEVTFGLTKNGEINLSYKDVEEYFKNNNISNPKLKDVREAVIFIRKNKLPDLETTGTAGSFFKNVVVSQEKFLELKNKYPLIPFFPASKEMIKVPIAWILDNVCHLKGFKMGNVGLYEKHPLIFINKGNGTAKEIKQLMEFVSQKFREVIDLTLEPEVVFVGEI